MRWLMGLVLILNGVFIAAAHAQWYRNNARQGSDIIMEEVRWPFWPQPTYFALWNYNPFPEGGYTYGGVAIHGPGTNATQEAYDKYKPAQVWTFWDSPAYKGVRPRFVGIGDTFVGAPGSGEGSCAGVSGWFPMMQINHWYRMVMRAWPDDEAPDTQGYNGWWFKDVASNQWYLVAVVSIPTKVKGLSGQSSFVETLGGDKYDVFDQRLMYHRFEGQWYSTDTILQQKPVTDNAWDLIENGTAIQFRRIPTQKPAGTNQTGDASFKITNQAPQPQLDPPRIVGVRASRVGNQLAVVWQVPPDSTPQVGYRVQAFAEATCIGAPVATLKATDPSGQAVRLEASAPAQSLRLTMRDIFDQEVTTNVLVTVGTPLPPQAHRATLPGLAYRYYEAPTKTNWDKLPDFTSLTPVSEGYVNHLTETIVPLDKYKLYGMVYTGRLAVPKTGVYVFDLRTCDGSRLLLDGAVVADNDGIHSVVTRRYAVALERGAHTFELDYFRSGNDRLNAFVLKDRIWLGWEGPGFALKAIGPESLGYVDLPTVPRLSVTCTFRDGNRGTVVPALDLRGQTFTRLEYYRDRVRIGYVENQSDAKRLEKLLPAGNGELWARLWYDNGRKSVDSQPVAYSAMDRKEGSWSVWTTAEKLPLAIDVTSNQVSLAGEGQCRVYRKVTGDFTITGKIADMPHWSPNDVSIHPACWMGLLCTTSTNQPSWQDFGIWDTFGWGMRGTVCDRDLECSGISRYAIVPREEHRPWVKIVRRGSHLRAYTSADGKNWTKGIDRVFNEPSPVAYVGVGMRADPGRNKALFGGTVSDIAIAQPGEAVPESPAYAVSKEDFYIGRAVSMVVATGTPRRLYLRTIGKGVRVSSDNGDTWTSLNTGLLANKPEALFVRSVAVHPTKPNIVLLGGGHATAGKTQSGLWRSEDSGKTWLQVSTEIDFRGDTPSALCGESAAFLGKVSRRRYHSWNRNQLLPAIGLPGNGGQQQARIGMRRTFEDILPAADLGDAPGVHDADVIGHVPDHAEVMRDQQNRHAGLALQVLDQPEDLRLDRHIQRRCRFIGDQKLRPAGQGHGDHDALFHATRHLVGVIVDARFGIGNADMAEQFDTPGAGRAAPHVLMLAQWLGQLAAHAVQRIERGHRLLENHPHAVAANALHFFFRGAEQVASLQADAAAGRMKPITLDQSHDRERRLGLATSRFADKTQSPARVDVKAHVINRLRDNALGDREIGLQVSDFQQCHARSYL